MREEKEKTTEEISQEKYSEEKKASKREKETRMHLIPQKAEKDNDREDKR